MFTKTARGLMVVFAVCAMVSYAAPPPDYVQPPQSNRTVDNTSYITGDNILMFVTNHGNYGRDLSGLFGYDAGTFYPFNTVADIQNGTMADYVMYAAGLWLGGMVDSDIRMAISEYSSEYVPGPMAGGTYLPDDPDFKVYHLYRDSLEGNPNGDYSNWPVDQGAPLDNLGKPLLYGDEMVWAVFNDADPIQHGNNSAMTDPLGVEVQMTAWTYHSDARTNPLGRTVYMQYKIFNKGGNTIDDFHIGLWADPDLGGAGDDLIGCDTLDNLFYTYNADNDDSQYGTTPPALGVKALYGPVAVSAVDTAFFDGSLMPGFANTEPSAFFSYINGTDPDNSTESYYNLRGLNKDGSPLANGTKFMFPGDPVAPSGDLDNNPTDKRMMISFGPIDQFLPGDSQYVLYMISVGQGVDNLSSLSDLRDNANGNLPQGPFKDPMVYLDVDTLFAYTANAIDPVPAVLYAGNFNGFTADEIVQSGSLTINGHIVPTSLEAALPPIPGFNGTVVKAEFDVRELVEDFVPFYDISMGEFTLEYSVPGFTPPPNSITGQVLLRGHISGDVNLDGAVNILDIIYLVEYRFHDGPAPRMNELADVNQDQALDLLDIYYIIDFLFRDGPAPLHP